jgi:hypothetical protein
MKHPTYKTLIVLLPLLAPLAGCGKSSTQNATIAGDLTQLQVLFNPMYSAFDGVHPFKVPAIVDNVDPSTVTWSLSDPSMADLVVDPGIGGVMIAPRKPGKVTVIATAGKQRGTSLLTITQATPDDWSVGNMRYNNGVVLTGGVGRQNGDGGAMKDVACTNCHGDTATAGPYRTVSHTPQQTGGFSDDDLLGIFTMGKVPVDGYFDSTVVNYNMWRQFHNWQMSPQEAKGIIVYLRSLTPQAQAGRRGDFGGRGRGDGGAGGIPTPPQPPAPGTPVAQPDARAATD